MMSNQPFKGEVRDVRGFNQVILKDFGELTITQGEEESLTIKTLHDLTSSIQSRVEDGKLTIEIDPIWLERLIHSFTLREVRYHLKVKDLNMLAVSGLAMVKINPLKTDQINLKLNGRISVEIKSIIASKLICTGQWGARLKILAGEVNDQKITLSNRCKYVGQQLSSKRAFLDLTSSKADVQVSDQLALHLTSGSNVTYIGEPTLKQKIGDDCQVSQVIP